MSWDWSITVYLIGVAVFICGVVFLSLHSRKAAKNNTDQTVTKHSNQTLADHEPVFRDSGHGIWVILYEQCDGDYALTQFRKKYPHLTITAAMMRERVGLFGIGRITLVTETRKTE